MPPELLLETVDLSLELVGEFRQFLVLGPQLGSLKRSKKKTKFARDIPYIFKEVSSYLVVQHCDSLQLPQSALGCRHTIPRSLALDLKNGKQE